MKYSVLLAALVATLTLGACNRDTGSAGAGAGSPDTAGTTGGTAGGTAGTTGTTGTAGTTGGGMADLDPGIRERLVELRQHLNLFEKAAGGMTGDPSAAADAPTSGTMPSGTTGATTPPTS